MKIIRNGFEFELTGEELRTAYYEQEHLFDVKDVKGKIEDEENEYGDAAEFILEHIDDVADEMRRNIDKYDMDWVSACDEAIETFCSRATD